MLDRKEKLDFKETKKFVTSNQILIDLSIDIYFIQLEKVIEERCDELDTMIDANGYEIIFRNMKRVATSIYNYKVYFINEHS